MVFEDPWSRLSLTNDLLMSKFFVFNLGKKNKNLNSSGFTITELIIVIGIVAIVSGMVLVAYRSGQYRHDLSNATESFVTDLRRAQSLSRTGKVQNAGDPANVRYGLATTTDAEYVLFRDLNGNFLYDGSPTDSLIETYSLPTKVRFQELSAVNRFCATFPISGENGIMIMRLNSNPQTGSYSLPIYSDRTQTNKVVVIEAGSGVIKVN